MNISTFKKFLEKLINIKQILLNERAKFHEEVLENLKELLITDPVLRVEEFDGLFSMDVKGDIFKRLVLHKQYEALQTQICLKYLDHTKDAIDVGANIGFYTVLFAKNLPNKKVLAIEPSIKAIKRLQSNILLNETSTNVIVHEGAVYDNNGSIKLKTFLGKEEYSTMGEISHPSIKREKWQFEEVNCETLDVLSAKYKIEPGFIKIDVEGVEHFVLRGATEILKNYRPIIVSELSDYLLKKNGSSAMEIVQFLEEYEYKMYDLRGCLINPMKQEFGEMICFPKEMEIQIV